MRPVYLNLFTGRIQESLAGSAPLNILRVTTGALPLTVIPVSGTISPLLDDDGSLITSGKLQVTGKATTDGVPDYNGDQLLGGLVEIETTPEDGNRQELTCGEDWKSLPLINLFGSSPITIALEYRWKNGADDEWTHSEWIKTLVTASLFADDTIPGDPPAASTTLALGYITSLIGSDETALDNLNLTLLATGTWIDIFIDGRGWSRWRVTDDGSDSWSTDTEAGVIVSVTGSNDNHLSRIGGY